MSSDSGALEPAAPAPRYEMPNVVGVSVRRVRPERRLRNFESSLPAADEAVEFVVETDEPIPIRALAPVLYVGDVPLTEVTADDPTHYRFVALQPEVLEGDAPLSLGWSGRPQDRQATTYRYEG